MLLVGQPAGLAGPSSTFSARCGHKEAQAYFTSLIAEVRKSFKPQWGKLSYPASPEALVHRAGECMVYKLFSEGFSPTYARDGKKHRNTIVTIKSRLTGKRIRAAGA